MWRSAVILMVVLVGCGASDGKDGPITSLTSLSTAFETAGFSCAAPAEYTLKPGKLPLGDKPAEVLRCAVDGTPVVALRWDTTDEAESTAAMLLTGACAAGRSHVAWVAEANWIAAADSDADLTAAQVTKVNDAIARATGSEVADYECVAH